MPGTITDAGSVAVNIDTAALTSAFSEALRQNAQPAAPAQSTASAFASKLAELGAADGTEPGTLAGLEQLFAAFNTDLTAKNQREMQGALKGAADRHAVNVIDLALQHVIGEDPVLAKYKSIFRQGTIDQFNRNPAYKAALNEYTVSGIIDSALLNKIAKEQVDEFNKDRQPAPKTHSPAGFKNDSTSESVARAATAGEGDGDNFDAKSLRDKRERAHYEAALGTAQKAGLGRDTPKAIAFASKKVRLFRAGVLKAKEAMGDKYITD